MTAATGSPLSISWRCRHSWRRASVNTRWGLLGCSLAPRGLSRAPALLILALGAPALAHDVTLSAGTLEGSALQGLTCARVLELHAEENPAARVQLGSLFMGFVTAMNASSGERVGESLDGDGYYAALVNSCSRNGRLTLAEGLIAAYEGLHGS